MIKRQGFKWYIILVVCLMPLYQVDAASLDLSNSYTRQSTNTDLSESLEIYSIPLFVNDYETGKWVRNQTIDLNTGLSSFVSEKEPNQNFSNINELKVGFENNYTYETLIKFGERIPDLQGGLLVNAELRLTEFNKPLVTCYYCSGYYQNDKYSIFSILENWNAKELTWLNKPEISQQPISTKTNTIPLESPTMSWNVTDFVKDWLQHPNDYYGFAIKANQDTVLTSFNRYQEDQYMLPSLKITYSPKPRKPNALSYGLQQNSGKGYVNLQWSKVTGAKGYRVYIYNGKEFEKVYEGTEANWSSLYKNIWPTGEQLANGETYLRLDGTGSDVSDTPGTLYKKQGDFSKPEDTYYFKISAFNDYGETDLTEEVSVKMVDATAPSVPTNVRIYNGILTWDESVDRSGVSYQVKITNESGVLVHLGATNTNSFEIPENYSKESYLVSVMAKDLNNYQTNYSTYSNPISVMANTKQYDSQLISYSFPTSVQEIGSLPTIRLTFKNIGKLAWSNEEGISLKSDLLSLPLTVGEIILPGETKTFDFQLPSNLDIGISSLRWQMHSPVNGNFGESRITNITFKDTRSPIISLSSPSENLKLSGDVAIQGNIQDEKLASYQVSYGFGESPLNWFTISKGTALQENLGTWRTNQVNNGAYTVRIEATDTSGNKSTLERKVYVVNDVPTPIVNEPTDDSTKITGTGKPGSTIYAFKDELVVGSNIVNQEGKFQVNIPETKAGTLLKIVSVDGVKESAIVNTIVKDVTPPSQPNIDSINNKSTLITGKSEPNITGIIKTATGNYSIQTDSTGYFSQKIPVQNAGSILSITMQDQAGFRSSEMKMTVTKVAPDRPTVNTVSNKAAIVSGKTEKLATITVTAGQNSYHGKADSYGNYKVTIPIQNSFTTLYVTAKDTTGKISAPNTIAVLRVAPNIPTADTVTNKSAYVTGKAEKSSLVSVKIGTKILNIRTDANGLFKIPIPVQNSGVKFTITAKDAKGQVSATKTVMVTRVAPNIPNVNPIRTYSTNVTGTTEKYAVVSVKIGGRTYSAKADRYGKFKVTISKQKKGSKLLVTSKDAKGAVSATRTMTVN
ncbi:Ig-like domain-containing protein [Ureibacillus sp. NPDC094379]